MRWAGRSGLRILTYHRFPEADLTHLERQCEYFRRYYRILTLDEAAGSLERGEEFPPYSLAITIDDGFRDFLGAHRVFERYEIPVTVYLMTGFLDGGWLWTEYVRPCFAHAAGRGAEIAGQTAGSPAEFNRIAKRLPDAERRAAVAGLAGQLKVEASGSPPEAQAPLSWDEVRELAGRGVTFGAHTVNHPILSRVAARDELKKEILGSKQRIEAELGVPCHHFCYPNGGPDDFTSEAVQVVREAGFRTATTMTNGRNLPDADPFRLKRLAMEPGINGFYFESVLTGLRRTA